MMRVRIINDVHYTEYGDDSQFTVEGDFKEEREND